MDWKSESNLAETQERARIAIEIAKDLKAWFERELPKRTEGREGGWMAIAAAHVLLEDWVTRCEDQAWIVTMVEMFEGIAAEKDKKKGKRIKTLEELSDLEQELGL